MAIETTKTRLDGHGLADHRARSYRRQVTGVNRLFWLAGAAGNAGLAGGASRHDCFHTSHLAD